MKQYWVVVVPVEGMQEYMNKQASLGWRVITVHPPEPIRVTPEYRSGRACRVIFEKASGAPRARRKDVPKLDVSKVELTPEGLRTG